MSDTSIPIGAATTSGTEASWSAKTWLAMLAMLSTSFALVSAEFLPAGLLTPLARDLNITEGMAGQVVTATALVGAITALLSNVLIGRLNRKVVLLCVSILAIVSNLLATFATDFMLLLVGRAGLGIALSTFWALAAAIVVRLVGTNSLGRGIAMVSLGVSLATIVAPALGAVVGDWLGWRTAVGITAALAGVALLLQLLSLPSMPAADSNSLSDVVRLLARRGIQLALLTILLLIAGHMTGSVYVRPFLEGVTGLSTGLIALALAGFGAAAVLGTVVAGKLADLSAGRAVAAAGGLMALAALMLVLCGHQIAIAFIFVALWGFAFGMAPVALQSNLSRAAPDALETAGSLMVVAFQVAIMTGAMVGGLIVDTYSPTANMLVTSVLATFALLLALMQPGTKA